MEKCVRVIDCGGNGCRRADVSGTEVKNLVPTTSKFELPVHLIEFGASSLLPETVAIAFASAGIIKDHSEVVIAPNIHILDGVNLAQKTKEATEKPSFVCNDMEASVTGMAKLFPSLKYFMGITWSSGIGMRIWKNGEILSDSEVGHIPLDLSPFAPLCGCGLRGCAEAVIGGDAIKRRVVTETQVRNIKIPEGMHPCAFLDDCFAQKKDWAVEMYEVIAIAMAMFLTTVQSTLRLPAVVWKGVFARNAMQKYDMRLGLAIKQKMRETIIDPAWADDMRFFMSPEPPKDRDSFIGAADIALKLLHK